ncbi:hypothetical protein LCGC14_2900440 [marine sediment metagenome]|uniref:B12-binding N-terminal domain-containing protein n=1 Tax=marine sediment metagenome TaxID=412755 RepID=A0A0F8YGF8_9ZZZZ
MADLTDIINGVFKGKLKEIQGLVQAVLDEGVNADQILDEGLVKGMDVVAQKWKEGEVFVPEVLRSAKTMQSGMDILKPLLGEDALKPKGVFAIGTVKGDLHDIGKNLVAIMLESVGYQVINLGIDLDPSVSGVAFTSRGLFFPFPQATTLKPRVFTKSWSSFIAAGSSPVHTVYTTPDLFASIFR